MYVYASETKKVEIFISLEICVCLVNSDGEGLVRMLASPSLLKRNFLLPQLDLSSARGAVNITHILVNFAYYSGVTVAELWPLDISYQRKIARKNRSCICHET